MNQIAISEALGKTLLLAIRNWRALFASTVYLATGLVAGGLAWELRNAPDLMLEPWLRTVQPVLFAALLVWAAVGVIRGLDGKMYRPPAKDKPARPPRRDAAGSLGRGDDCGLFSHTRFGRGCTIDSARCASSLGLRFGQRLRQGSRLTGSPSHSQFRRRKAKSEPLALDAYQARALRSDRTRIDGGEAFMLLGLFGETGSALSELKKKQRDLEAYAAYAPTASEELGDVLWYMSNLSSRLGIPLSELAAEMPARQRISGLLCFEDLQIQPQLIEVPASSDAVESSLLRLAGRVGRLVDAWRHREDPDRVRRRLISVFEAWASAADQASLQLEQVAEANLAKVFGRWPETLEWGDLYDGDHPDHEQLPRVLEVFFQEREVDGVISVVQFVNGSRLGDQLTDNRVVSDDYRFHDVFHWAYAAILGWSPVLRALLKVKRKSVPSVDEQEDGARAAITEEGISNWVFVHALRRNAFAEVKSIDFDLLRTIREMVQGYEVENRPVWMWEHAILEGFRIFRALKAHRQGFVRIDLNTRTIEFRPSE